MQPTGGDWTETPPITVSLEAQPSVGNATRERGAPADRQATISIAPILGVRSTLIGRSAIEAPPFIGARNDVESLPLVPG